MDQNKSLSKPMSEAFKDHVRECFASGEHVKIGNDITLEFSSTEDPDVFSDAEETLLRLPNGLKLTFGQIVALAGDYYGVPQSPIIDPNEKPETQTSGRRRRFVSAYSTLAHADYTQTKKEVDQLLEVIKEETRALETGEYDKLGNSLVEKCDEITGGTWILGVPVKKGRVMKLAENNHDHFLPFAQDAYSVGHGLAIEKAKEASRVSGPRGQKMRILEEAYSIDAFACHFLTDSFSSGHLRTPRRELPNQVTPSSIGHLLCKYMHDEDSTFGIRVTNKRRENWIAYGDGMLLNKESKKNFQMAVDAVQASVAEVYEAFVHPENFPSSSRVTDYIPCVDPSKRNNYPMFRMKDSALHRRVDLENLSDPNTTTYWTGVGTVYDLRSYKPHGSAIERGDDNEEDRREALLEVEPQLQFHALKVQLGEIPQHMSLFSHAMRALYVNEDTKAERGQFGRYTTHAKKLRKLRDETRIDAIVYQKCTEAILTKFVACISTYVEHYSTLTYEDWCGTLEDIVRNTGAYKQLAETVTFMHEDILKPLMKREGQLEIPELTVQQQWSQGELGEKLSLLSWLPVVSPLFLAGAAVAEAIEGFQTAEVSKFKQSLKIMINNFIKALSVTTSFSLTMEKELKKFECRAKKATESPKKLYFKVMHAQAAEIESLCKSFCVALPAVQTELAFAITSVGTDDSYMAGKWLDMQTRMFKAKVAHQGLATEICQ